METQTFEQENKQIAVHTFEENESCFPFAVLETTTINEEKEIKTFEPVLGNKRIVATTFETMGECVDFINSKPYPLILALICDTIEMKEKWEKEQQELLKTKQNEIQS